MGAYMIMVILCCRLHALSVHTKRYPYVHTLVCLFLASALQIIMQAYIPYHILSYSQHLHLPHVSYNELQVLLL